MNYFNDQMKSMLKSVPWQFKLLWVVGVLLSFGLLGGIFWLLAVLIRHFS